jgi:hypothetical protein
MAFAPGLEILAVSGNFSLGAVDMRVAAGLREEGRLVSGRAADKRMADESGKDGLGLAGSGALIEMKDSQWLLEAALSSPPTPLLARRGEAGFSSYALAPGRALCLLSRDKDPQA